MDESQLAQLHSHDAVLAAWRAAGGTAAAARDATRAQVAAFRALVADDGGWERLLRVHARGRAVDSWLALDWPQGFDELLLCAPLCALVRFECARCTIGSRQEGYSCAHPGTVFGKIDPLLEAGRREALLEHLDDVAAMLDDDARRWDPQAGVLRS